MRFKLILLLRITFAETGISKYETIKTSVTDESGDRILMQSSSCVDVKRNMPVCSSAFFPLRLRQMPSILYKSLKLLSSCSISSAIFAFISLHSKSFPTLSAV